MFKQRCELCRIKIDKGKEVTKKVKLPEFTIEKERPFCSEEHGNQFKYKITGTKRTSYCPSCGV